MTVLEKSDDCFQVWISTVSHFDKIVKPRCSVAVSADTGNIVHCSMARSVNMKGLIDKESNEVSLRIK